jgi:non-specific serine/threonine protein kinase
MFLGLIDQHATRLPAEVTSFVGRERDLAGVTALLRGSRLVTVTGTGGVGKTRLAARAASRLAGQFGDGALVLDLSAVPDPAAALDDTLDALYERNLLLLLDTCDHMVDACATFAREALAAAPGVTLLATSRQPLDVPGEATYRLAPMPAPGANAGETDCEVMRLFAQRAAAVVPGFTITGANRPMVARVCRRLDGIPLAVELAAVRLRALPLHELAARLEQRPEMRPALLTGGRRGSVRRHQGMRETAKWSYDSCTPAERALWERLSVFAGGFSIDAAQEVCASGELPRERVIESVASLTDKSVLLREDGDCGTRYRLLESLREFGAERLAESGAEAPIKDRHAVRYLALARQFSEGCADAQKGQRDDHRTCRRDGQAARTRELGADHENFTAALEYMLGEARDGDRKLERDGAELARWLHTNWSRGRLNDALHSEERAGEASEGHAGAGEAGAGEAGEGHADEGVRAGTQGPEDPLAGLLTSRQRQIAGLVATGLSNRQIAQSAGISKRTVDAHVAHIFAKLGVSSRERLTSMVRGHT